MTDPTGGTPHVEHYGNGRLKMRGAHLDGEMHGPWDWYRLDGSLMRTGVFDRGRQIGSWRTYDRSGNLVKGKPTSGQPSAARADRRSAAQRGALEAPQAFSAGQV